MKKAILIVFIACFCKICFCQWVQGGIGWELQNTGTTTIIPCDNSHIWAFGLRGFPIGPYYQMQRSYARSNDGGINWTINEIIVPDSFVRQLVCITSYDTAWIRLGKYNSNEDNQQLFRTQNGGVTWEPQFPQWMLDSNITISHMHFFDNLMGLGMGYRKNDTLTYTQFIFYMTIDGGDTWNEIPDTNIPTTAYFEPLQAFSSVDSLIWISTNQNRILKSSDWGVHWQFVNSPVAMTNGNMFPLFINHNHGILKYLGTGFNPIYETNNGGITWTPIFTSGPLLTSNSQLGICIVPGTTNTFVCNVVDGCWYSFDGCHNWNEFPELTGLAVSNVAFTDVNHGWAGTLTTLPQPTNTGFWKYFGNLVSTNELSKTEIDLKVLPNPSYGNIALCITGAIDLQIFVSFLNLNGQSLYNDRFIQMATTVNRNYILDNLRAGVYLVKVSIGNEILTKMIVILPH